MPLCLLLGSGCLKPHELPPPPPRPLPGVIDAVNQNNQRLDRPLYSPLVEVHASLTDDDAKRHDLDLRGRLVLQRPQSIWLNLDHTLESDQLQLGSNGREYWLIIRRSVSTMWWGKHEHLGKPCVQPLRIDPCRLADAWGLTLLPNRGMLGPYRICEERFDVLVYGRIDGELGVLTDRAYRIDRFAPHMIRGVSYFDRLGREEVVVSLDDYQPVAANGPLLARKISLFWPKTKDSMRMTLSALQVKDQVHPRTFERPLTPPPGVRSMVQVDEACDSEAKLPLPVPAVPASQEAAP